MPSYNIVEDSIQQQFHDSRAKIQIFGGGFGNGKTAAGCIKALRLARDYPGSNGLVARATYPKLNDTIRKELFKWCPVDWIKSFNKADNTLILTNGSVINFRYVAQQGKSAEQSTSNLLSATYDWILVDQVEDPEITHKDFMDLLGRLRGKAKYDPPKGEWDNTMPVNGSRWMMLLCNPTRNWFYRKIVKPLHIYKQSGRKHPDLIVNKAGEPIIDLFEGSSYTNSYNLDADFLETLESSYTDKMKKRFIDGEWGAYEGLVYSDYEYDTHVVPHQQIVDYLGELLASRAVGQLSFLEGYDYGLQVPCCYLLSFVDHKGNVIILDGFYETGWGIGKQATEIKRIRDEYILKGNRNSYADPAMFRRTANKSGSGQTVANLFEGEDISFSSGASNIEAGITKINGYLKLNNAHQNPFTGAFGAPFLYVSDKLEFFDAEISDYYWKRDTSGDGTDTPMDKNDHAMDATKFMLSNRPNIAKVIAKYTKPPAYMSWGELDLEQQSMRLPRHA